MFPTAISSPLKKQVQMTLAFFENGFFIAVTADFPLPPFRQFAMAAKLCDFADHGISLLSVDRKRVSQDICQWMIVWSTVGHLKASPDNRRAPVFIQ